MKLTKFRILLLPFLINQVVQANRYDLPRTARTVDYEYNSTFAYVPIDVHMIGFLRKEVSPSIAACSQACDREDRCLIFEYRKTQMVCVLWKGYSIVEESELMRSEQSSAERPSKYFKARYEEVLFQKAIFGDRMCTSDVANRDYVNRHVDRWLRQGARKPQKKETTTRPTTLGSPATTAQNDSSVTTTMISPNGSTSQEISTTLGQSISQYRQFFTQFFSDSHNSTDLSEEATVGATATTTHERRPTTPLERYSSILDSYKTLQMVPTTAVDDDTSEGQKETESGRTTGLGTQNDGSSTETQSPTISAPVKAGSVNIDGRLTLILTGKIFESGVLLKSGGASYEKITILVELNCTIHIRTAKEVRSFTGTTAAAKKIVEGAGTLLELWATC